LFLFWQLWISARPFFLAFRHKDEVTFHSLYTPPMLHLNFPLEVFLVKSLCFPTQLLRVSPASIYKLYFSPCRDEMLRTSACIPTYALRLFPLPVFNPPKSADFPQKRRFHSPPCVYMPSFASTQLYFPWPRRGPSSQFYYTVLLLQVLGTPPHLI